MINEITINKLRQIPVAGGDIFHLLKKSDPEFLGFGEAYISTVDHGHIKAWKRHLKMTMNLVVISGLVKFVFYDESSKKYRCEIIGNNNYVRLTVPPGLWFGFKGVSTDNKNLVINFADIEHDIGEVERRSIDEIIYNWSAE